LTRASAAFLAGFERSEFAAFAFGIFERVRL
jgi:hypothetical protein